MTSTWNKVITGLALVAVLSSQIGVASACGNRRRTASSTVAPVAIAPIAATPSVVMLPPVDEAPAVAPIDLELYDIRLVDNGNDEQGPGYRLIVKNLGKTAVTSEITVALLASMEKDSDDNVSVIGSLASLEAGATKSVDLRLPKGAELLTYLTAVVAQSDGTDANETDNIATYERDTVLAAR